MKKIWALVAVIFVPAALWSLDLQTVLESVSTSLAVQLAETAVSESTAKIEEARYPGDLQFSAQPEITVDSPVDGPLAETVEIRGSVGVAIPLGLTDAKTAYLSQAIRTAEQDRRIAQFAGERAFLDLFILYQQAWEAQEILDFSEMARDVAEDTYSMKSLLFERGQLSLVDFAAAEETLARGEDAVAEARMDHRLSWIELAAAVGFDWKTPLELESPNVNFGVLPTPVKLDEWAGEYHLDIVNQQEKALAIAKDIKALENSDLTAVFKSGLNAFTHNATMSYSTASSSLTANYSFPITTIQQEPAAQSTGGSSVWSISLSALVSLDLGRDADLAADTLHAELASAYTRLSAVKESVSLDIRSKYQQFRSASDAVDTAARSLERAEAAYQLALTKNQLQQLTDTELAETEILVKRAELQLELAKVSETRSALSAAHAAAYLETYVRKED